MDVIKDAQIMVAIDYLVRCDSFHLRNKKSKKLSNNKSPSTEIKKDHVRVVFFREGLLYE